MAIDQPYSFDPRLLERSLAQMEFRQILCFAASCAERMAPVVKLWSEQTSHIVDHAISNCWDILIGLATSVEASPYFEQLTLAHQEVTVEIDRNFKPELPFVQDAIVSAIYMLQYANSQQVTFAALCVQRAYIASDQLAYKMALALGSEQIFENDLLVSEPVQAELQQQRLVLDLLAIASPEVIPIERLRPEARQAGSLFLQRLIRYCELERTGLKGSTPLSG